MAAQDVGMDEASKDREIRQLIPTSGHLAVYFDEETGEPWADPLVGWALVGEIQNRAERPKVIGLVSEGKDVVLVDEFPNFLGYLSPEGGLDEWREDANQAWEEVNRKKESGLWPDTSQRRRS